MATNWRVYGSETVAAVLDKAELPGFYREAIVGPNEAALVIRNGKLEEVVTEVRLGTSGFRDRLKGLIGRESDAQVIFVDTSPFDLTFFLGESTRGEQGNFRQEQQSTAQRGSNISMGAEQTGGAYAAQGLSVQSQLDSASVAIEALTSDRQFISAQVRLTMAVGIDDAELVTRLLRGRTALAVADVGALVRDELVSKVLVPMVARSRADELRGNTGLLNEIAGATERELSTAAGIWGLTLYNFFLNWGVTEQERAEIEEARKRREEEAAEFAHQRVIRDRERGLDLERTRLNNLQELKVLEVRGDEELKEVYLNSEIDRSQLLDGQRVSVASVDAQIRSIEMGIRREEADLLAEIEQRRKEMELENQRRQSQLRLEELEGQRRLEMTELEHAVNLQSRRREERHLQDRIGACGQSPKQAQRRAPPSRLGARETKVRSLQGAHPVSGIHYRQGSGYRSRRCQRLEDLARTVDRPGVRPDQRRHGTGPGGGSSGSIFPGGFQGGTGPGTVPPGRYDQAVRGHDGGVQAEPDSGDAGAAVIRGYSPGAARQRY